MNLELWNDSYKMGQQNIAKGSLYIEMEGAVTLRGEKNVFNYISFYNINDTFNVSSVTVFL
jgi:hypothetical protein